MILRFLHGWGFDADFWSGLVAELPGWRTECDDRGYFRAAQPADSKGSCIVVAHSFGTMRALSSPPAHCEGLVAINGFDRFTASGERPGVSPRIVDRMIAKFDEDPSPVLSDFRHRCGDDAPFGPADIGRLRDDLVALREMDCTTQSAAWPTPVLSLQGARDPLLPLSMREGVFAATPILERMTHPSGGHLLPVTDAPYCARAIGAFVERLA